MVLLTLSVTVIGAPHRKPVFFFALYILSVGEGGHRPCVQTFAADQFDEETPEQRKRKSSFFNWWYVGLVVGSTLAVFLIIYVQVLFYFFIYSFIYLEVVTFYYLLWLQEKDKISPKKIN